LSGSAAAQTLPAGHGVPWSTSSPSGHAGTPKHLTTSILKQAVKPMEPVAAGEKRPCHADSHLRRETSPADLQGCV
ncbi:hypothetical protein, partial [Teichococcus aestuarii]|uniref:hypothetical protein n=1 Tax=Teichococcus aestuarii TaxID=568898 RepID=UPI001C630118